MLFLVLGRQCSRTRCAVTAFQLPRQHFQTATAFSPPPRTPPHSGTGPTFYRSPTSTTTSSSLFSTATDETFPSTSLPSYSSQFLLDGLNDAQIEAVTQPFDSITRVVAGPGAGKTRVLTTRIAHLLLEDDPRNNRVLAVTFTKKAAGEMKARLDGMLGDGGEQHLVQRAMIGTFHSVCCRLLRWNGELLKGLPSVKEALAGEPTVDLDGSYTILDQREQLAVLKNITDSRGIKLKEENIKPISLLAAIGRVKSDVYSNGQDTLNSAGLPTMTEEQQKEEKKRRNSRMYRMAKEIYPDYRRKTLSQNMLDFDDLILLTGELLEVHPDIQEMLQRRWPHVLVDEFQDSSRAQLKLVRLWTSRSLMVVGDADQSIYSWRGAHVGSMTDFLRDFDQFAIRGVDTVYLMENYRSTSNIVKAAQKVISVGDGSGADSTIASANRALRKDMKPMRGDGATPRVLACADAKAEANFVVDTIQDMIGRGELTAGKSSVAVIYRTNAQSRSVEEACVAKKLPYVMAGSAKFYNRQEIKDVLCFLQLIHAGGDLVSFARACKTPIKGIGDKSRDDFLAYWKQVGLYYNEHHPDLPRPSILDLLLALSKDADEEDNDGDDIRSKGDFELVDGAPSVDQFLKKRSLTKFLPFSKQMRQVREKAYTQTISELMDTVISVMDLQKHVDSISKSQTEFEDRWTNVQELRTAGERYKDDGPCLQVMEREDEDEDMEGGFMTMLETPLSVFLDDVSLVSDVDLDTEESKSEPVVKAQLMTIHGSKGMEFDVVFLIGCEEGTLPFEPSFSRDDDTMMDALPPEKAAKNKAEEERRLCYVAMTRAIDHLIITWRREVTIFAGKRFKTIDKQRSKFLDVLVGPSRPPPRRRGGRTTNSNKGGARPSRGYANPYGRQKRPKASSRAEVVANTLAKMQEKYTTPTRRKSRANYGDGDGDVYQTTSAARKRASQKAVQSGDDAALLGGDDDGEYATSTKKKSAFVVGSRVIHLTYGEGQVLPPQSSSRKIRIKFEYGEELEFAPSDRKLFPKSK